MAPSSCCLCYGLFILLLPAVPANGPFILLFTSLPPTPSLPPTLPPQIAVHMAPDFLFQTSTPLPSFPPQIAVQVAAPNALYVARVASRMVRDPCMDGDASYEEGLKRAELYLDEAAVREVMAMHQ